MKCVQANCLFTTVLHLSMGRIRHTHQSMFFLTWLLCPLRAPLSIQLSSRLCFFPLLINVEFGDLFLILILLSAYWRDPRPSLLVAGLRQAFGWYFSKPFSPLWHLQNFRDVKATELTPLGRNLCQVLFPLSLLVTCHSAVSRSILALWPPPFQGMSSSVCY